MSPAMFIVYAEGAMRQVRAACTSPSCLPTHFSQYADDTTIHDTDRDAVVAAAAKCEPIFAQDDLRLNLTKTQFVTPSKDDDAWRKTKLLGSLLGSGSDIENRINAANRAFGTIAWNRHTLLSRMLMFTTLILPVLLYNCGPWTLTAALGNRLDTWHRCKLRSILGVVYPQNISNKNLYKLSNQLPITRTCRERRLLWFGHVIREGSDSTSYKALRLSIDTKDIKKPRGRPVTRWIDNIKNDLKTINVSIAEAEAISQDKEAWLGIVNQCTNLSC